jgi:hypothetical protein
MKKLSELRTIGIMCSCVAACNRAIEYRASSKLHQLSEDITRLIDHEIGDHLEEKRKKIEERQAVIIVPFRAELDANAGNEQEINARYDQALQKDEEIAQINAEINELWGQTVEFELPVIDVPYRDFSESFPIQKKSGVFAGYKWEADGLDVFAELDKRGVVKVV